MKHNFDFDKCSPTNPFTTPEGYFDDFARRMEVATAPRRLSITQRSRTYWYAAAAVVLVLSVGAFFFQSYRNNSAIGEHTQELAVKEYDDAVNLILEEETNEAMIVDYILANAE